MATSASGETYQGMAKVVIEGRMHGSITNNVLFFGLLGEGGEVDWPAVLLTLATAVVTCIVETLLPAVSVDWSFTRVRVSAVIPDPTDEIFATADEGVTTTGALTEALPSYCAAVLSLRTGHAGKSSRGRMYVAGIAEADQTLSFLTAGANTRLVAFAACLIEHFVTSMSAGDWRLGVFSRKLGLTGGVYNMIGFREVKTINVDQALGSANSRKVGRGI